MEEDAREAQDGSSHCRERPPRGLRTQEVRETSTMELMPLYNKRSKKGIRPVSHSKNLDGNVEPKIN